MDPATPAAAVTRSFHRFGLRLFAQLDADGNRFCSPFSVAVALAALSLGARGATRDEIAGALGLGGEEALAAVAELLTATASRTVSGIDFVGVDGEAAEVEQEVLRLAVATALFVAAGYPLHDRFGDRLGELFAADLLSLSFADPEAAAGRINGWVAERTAGRIGELVSAESLDATTRMVLANAVHFKARWEETFPVGTTEPRPFHLEAPEGATVEVAMMRRQGELVYARSGDGAAEVVHLPYEGEASMAVVLPAAGRRRQVERRLFAGGLDALLAGGGAREVALELPRFELRSEADLVEALRRLGIAHAFDPECADFAAATPHPEGLFVGNAIHQAWIEVDEEGTEAAAATALMAVAVGAPVEPEEPIPFVVDRPFLFVIRDDRTGATLFLGRVLDPTA